MTEETENKEIELAQAQVAIRPKSPMAIMQDILINPTTIAEMSKAATKFCSAERMIRIFLTFLKKNPKIALCTKESLMGCCMDATAMGLEIDGKKLHLLAYGNEAKLIVDYKGIAEIARRSGEIADIHCDIVCEGDEFSFAYGSGAHLKHNPVLVNRGTMVAAYSFVKFKNGNESFEVLTKDEIDKVRQSSRSGSRGPWQDWPEAMAKKTAFRRHAKTLPCMPPEMALALDNDYDGGKSYSVVKDSTPRPLKRFSTTDDSETV